MPGDEESKKEEEAAEVVPQWEAVNDAKALWTAREAKSAMMNTKSSTAM